MQCNAPVIEFASVGGSVDIEPSFIAVNLIALFSIEPIHRTFLGCTQLDSAQDVVSMASVEVLLTKPSFFVLR